MSTPTSLEGSVKVHVPAGARSLSPRVLLRELGSTPGLIDAMSLASWPERPDFAAWFARRPKAQPPKPEGPLPHGINGVF